MKCTIDCVKKSNLAYKVHTSLAILAEWSKKKVRTKSWSRYLKSTYGCDGQMAT